MNVIASIDAATVRIDTCYGERSVSMMVKSLQPYVDGEMLHQESILVQKQKYVRFFVHVVEYAKERGGMYTKVAVQVSTISTLFEN